MCKKWIVSFLFLFSLSLVNAQFRKVPAEVTDAFKAKYGKADHVSWKDKFSSFQADFKIGENNMKSLFNSKGEWLKTETKFSFESLPAEVKDGFRKSKYADMVISEVLEIEEKDKGSRYKMTVKKGDFNKKSLVFAKTGQLVSDNGVF